MFEFTKDCHTGIELIDGEHQKLFDMINYASMENSKESASLETLQQLIVELKEYAAVHFAHEEAYMEEHNDPELARQRMEHEAFAKKVNEFDIEKDSVNDILVFLARWLYHHILGSDIMIGRLEKITENMFEFTDKYKTGIELVDTEHKRLFEIISDTNDIIHAEYLHDKYDEIVRILGELKDYTVMHFADEEEYMKSIGYDGLAAQQRAHEAFVDKLNDINFEDIDNNQEEYLNDLIEYLLGWLINHILKVDKLIPVK